jgi:hypothetical protein
MGAKPLAERGETKSLAHHTQIIVAVAAFLDAET